MRATFTYEVFIAYLITLFSFGFLTPLFTILASSATIILAIYGVKRGLSSSKREQEQAKRNEIEHQNRVRIQQLEILRLENEIGIDAEDTAKRLKEKDDNNP